MGHNWFRFDPADIYQSRGLWVPKAPPQPGTPAGPGSWGYRLYSERVLSTGAGWGSEGTWTHAGTLLGEVLTDPSGGGHVEGSWDTPGALFAFRTTAPHQATMP